MNPNLNPDIPCITRESRQKELSALLARVLRVRYRGNIHEFLLAIQSDEVKANKPNELRTWAIQKLGHLVVYH